jgi:hypothetical protein
MKLSNDGMISYDVFYICIALHIFSNVIIVFQDDMI